MSVAYTVGDRALLGFLMGEEITPPRPVVITKAGELRGGRMFEYEVEVDAKTFKLSHLGRIIPPPAPHFKVWVMAKWLSPAQIVIQEVPESPFD